MACSYRSCRTNETRKNDTEACPKPRKRVETIADLAAECGILQQVRRERMIGTELTAILAPTDCRDAPWRRASNWQRPSGIRNKTRIGKSSPGSAGATALEEMHVVDPGPGASVQL
jgi:hypothetical protein